VVHAAFREAEGKLRGGNQVGGGGVERIHPANLTKTFSGCGC
jgi:hypothetical protein